MKSNLKSREMCQLLGIRPSRLAYLIREGKVDPPDKDISGDYVWPPGSVERVRKAMATDLRRRKAEAATA